MAFDMDPFSTLDVNFDTGVDAVDLQTYELTNHGTYGLDDIDHDMVLDKIDNDLNNDNFADEFQTDLNNNNVIDKFEQNMGMTSLNYDVNQDGDIDYIDQALAKSIYNL
ncbi:hypothetical protein LG326_12630 [Metaplanococcus flavidus]